MNEIANNYAGLENQKSIKNQTAFSARFDKQDNDDQVLDEFEFYTNLNINKN